MAKSPKKKVELNEEALALCKSLRVAMALDKQANCVTHGGKLIAVTSVGVVYTPFDLAIASAFKVEDLINALDGCTGVYSLVEDLSKSTLVVSWGRRRATIDTLPKITVYAPPASPIQNDKVSETFKEDIVQFVSDLLPRENDVASSIVYFDGYEAYWTNRAIAGRLQTTTWLPPILMFVKDLRTLARIESKIVGIGGDAHSITFHFEDETALQLPLVDDSSVTYPKDAVKGLFHDDILSTEYPVTSEFIEAVNYVAKFSNATIHVSPEHVGTDESPLVGTSVECSDIPLELRFLSETVRLGAFKGAETIVKSTGKRPIGFATRKKGVTFVFVKIKGE